jgi:hypothetical protein
MIPVFIKSERSDSLHNFQDVPRRDVICATGLRQNPEPVKNLRYLFANIIL